MDPYSGVRASEIIVVDLDTGVVVPQSDVGDGYLDDGDEPIVLAQATFVELRYMFERYVQAAPIASREESGYHILPGSVFGRCSGLITIVGAKEYVPGLGRALCQRIFYGLLLLVTHHEQGGLTMHGSVFHLASIKKIS